MQHDNNADNETILDPINRYRTLVEAASEGILVNTATEPSEPDVRAVRALLSGAQRVVCELGSGSGRHLITLAKRSPDTVFIGMELRYKRAYRTIEKARQQGVSNLFVLRANAQDISKLFPAESLEAIYINFPDPWDKRRWLKNRLIQERFVAELANLLRPGGFFSYKTDHPEYFASAVAIIRANPRFAELRITDDLSASPWIEESVPTEFELLFRAKGLPICYSLFERIG